MEIVVGTLVRGRSVVVLILIFLGEVNVPDLVRSRVESSMKKTFTRPKRNEFRHPVTITLT